MNKNSAKRRLNLLDIALILLAVLSFVGIWQRSNLQQLFTKEELLESYTVTFEIKKVRSTTADLLQEDTELYILNGEERVRLGTLAQRVSAAPATVYLQDREGNTVQSVYPQDANEYLLDVSGILHCEGVEHDGSFLLGGRVYLATNQTIAVQTETADLEIRITGIQRNV